MNSMKQDASTESLEPQAEEASVSISLTVENAAAALDFYTEALGAKELFRMNAPDGSVGHAEFMLGNTRLYISGESADWKIEVVVLILLIVKNLCSKILSPFLFIWSELYSASPFGY